ncbi:YceI family protein [Alloacidobacterium dinghuense]|uniref:YceI family protein n=1 Tax=Alloacidobacterium dinghuense TaxID=2763107 RepID=A0A7G8BC92_9BACT|nr:YceI family protein [Alloacidobacterium dinghuense]QNI30162.1 YceI family protein [Alloacidobacterium dinghuense]
MREVSTEAANHPHVVAGLYTIDSRASRFTVRAFATGFLAKLGHSPTIGIHDFSGGMSFNPEKVEAGSFYLVIKTASLSVQDDISDKDRREIERLMHKEVLETEKFPEIRYAAAVIGVTKMSEMLYSASLNGDLTLHGITRSQPITSRVTLLGNMLRASGDFSLDQTDYGTNLVSVAGGALKLKDRLMFSFEIVARKQE